MRFKRSLRNVDGLKSWKTLCNRIAFVDRQYFRRALGRLCDHGYDVDRFAGTNGPNCKRRLGAFMMDRRADLRHRE